MARKPRRPDGYTRRKKPYWTEFECPVCTADNYYDDGFGDGDDVDCQYCSTPMRVVVEETDGPPVYTLQET